MIDQIISFSIRHKFVIGLMTLVWIAAGVWSMMRVPLDAVPDITNNQVQVITQAPNLGTEDIEQFVTYPVELAMANLPGVVEIRSISRFGLSVVTIVFEDDMGTFLPRQLVAEKLTEVREDIPPGFGDPSMGPISTGLGEILQYTLEVDSAHRKQYSAADLRTIQDWIVKRQMAMVPGVIEVNSFGGYIKQYEVAVNPDELRAIGLTISDVFRALEDNNQNTGGAYIEKDHKANFIRGEGLARSLDDLRHVVVTNVNGLPIMIKDVAEVGYGEAVRYGAMTKDGEGEAVGGIIMMLKDANSNEVIEAVKERMAEIQKSLPEGISIEPFLDRSKLIANTTSTISNNLLEGALIVIFVLVFLLGNWRGGLIVASTIPLSLLFAFIMMHIFNVWANLMSLGAIDFGIIVDGAVIIVESTVFLLHQRLLKGGKIDKSVRDETAKEASSKMMNSAFFGQLIILIVFIPILALQGVEGKMFKPMALTFMFAMMGVMILCLTYVPMMSAWFLKVGKGEKRSWGDRFVEWLERRYSAVLAKALKRAKWIGATAVALFALAIFTFSRMGGEFIPQLDEGDLAFHAILKPGSALSETIAATTQVEKLIVDEYPEVEHVLCRIGVADVPTDPMPMDFADCFVILKPKEEWVSAESKEALINSMKDLIEEVPGVNYEFTQPIEMRFNELISGVREDIAIKLFGEDLEILAAKAAEMSKIIANVPGVGDMKVEATSGLPQITVRYNRRKMAQYGLHIKELNTIVETAFAGGVAGVIFEGEKRFDLVVRLDEQHRTGIDDLRNLYVNLPNGSQIPLKEVADVTYQPGPMQISRDNTNRRIYVGVNIRGRDMKSVVDDIRKRLDEQLELPPGYYIRYGGAFENFERATKRLKMVVPIALGLIFLLIFLALDSLKQTVMIYVTIPLATIGGVFALWLRGMTFSISAGVGFIVLFGVAVLNGLVLINGWNELKQNSSLSLRERIVQGARRRIRPILLTALTDVLGFLPMAISTSAGAEVQRPLATVVIGGMITATLLTLFVLPIIYRWVESRGNSKGSNLRPAHALLLLGIFFFAPFGKSHAQQRPTLSSLDEALLVASSENGLLQAQQLEVEARDVQAQLGFAPPKTQFSVEYGQYNSFQNDLIFQVNQSFEWPTAYANRKELASRQVLQEQAALSLTANELRRNVRLAWYRLKLLHERKKQLILQDSLYGDFLRAAETRYQTGATGYLEKAAAETRKMESENALRMLQSDIAMVERELRILLSDSSNSLRFEPSSAEPLRRSPATVLDSSRLAANPSLAYAQQQIAVSQAEIEVQRAQRLPEFALGYFNQSAVGSIKPDGEQATLGTRLSGVQLGLAVPLFGKSWKTQTAAAEIRSQMAQTQAAYVELELRGKYEQALQALLKYENSLQYYEEKALPQATLILESAQKAFEAGAIDYVEYFQNVQQALQIRLDYLSALEGYDKAVIDLEYLLGL